jgi:hypothetical protein
MAEALFAEVFSQYQFGYGVGLLHDECAFGSSKRRRAFSTVRALADWLLDSCTN